jgi:hypothetical protein
VLAIVSVLALSAFAIWFDPERPFLQILVILSAVHPWGKAWAAARGTALRPALVWGRLAFSCLMLATMLAVYEPLASGRSLQGRLTYIAVLAFLAAFISVFNARTPGQRVWAWLMVMLVAVFLIPWLEAPGRLRSAGGLAPLHLEAPWTLFYLVLVLAGVSNYLPTRFGVAAVGFALGFLLEFLGLTRPDWPQASRAILWCWVSWVFAASLWIARWSAYRAPSARLRLERQWFWFRDAWGVVWALRIAERFNREAGLRQWPMRLEWFGLMSTVEPSEGTLAEFPSEEAEATLRGLLRRFVEPGRLEEL